MAENNKRGFVEFSVVLENVIYEAIGNQDFILTSSDFQSYIYHRAEMFATLDDYEFIKTDEVSSNPMARANYNTYSRRSNGNCNQLNVKKPF